MQAVDLSGQVAIVTGGGRGIGRTITQSLALAGAAVAVAGRTVETLDNTVNLIRASGGKAIPVVLDVTDEASVQAMVQEVERQLGSVDVLVNNAGILGKVGPLWEASSADWWQVMDVNVRGPFLCMQAVLPEMIRRRTGKIINLSSRAAAAPGVAYTTAYNASKAALVRLTAVVAQEVAEYDVAVFALDPGLVHTDMVDYIVESHEGQQWRPDIARWLEMGEDTPIECAASAITYLASGQANALTGRFFSCKDDLPDLVSHIEDIEREDKYALRWRR